MRYISAPHPPTREFHWSLCLFVCQYNSNYYSFALSSTRYAKKLKEEFDVVFVNQLSPVMMAWPAMAYKKKHKVKMMLYCLDLWPESLTFGGVKRDGIIYNIFRRVSARIYRAADKIIVSSRSFGEVFKKQFGMSFGRYERNFRLNGAENALRRGCSLKEAADLWGFCDKSHLSRLLKQRT